MVRYADGWRRTLLDMHIPDWDPAFLSRYDPRALGETYRNAGVQSVMLYCKSHVGLCYWPTPHGKVHDAVKERDVVGELVGQLRERDIGVCLYYSISFDNWAVETHPEWRQRTAGGFDLRGILRYGTCCLNNPEYRAYELAQTEDLLSRYDADAVFYDMIFWSLPCGCEHCATRFGAPLPETVDWTDPSWCAFQAARERWADELAAELASHSKRVRPGIDVTHNFAPALSNWRLGQNPASALHDDFVAGDLYGDRFEQLFVSKLMLNLTNRRPAEFMTSRCVNLQDHVRLKSTEQLKAQALAATAMSSAFLLIDAVDPVGTVSSAVYDRVREVSGTTSPYEPYLGGEPVEDVAVWFSVDSQMDFAENGTPVATPGLPSSDYPHVEAARGACRALQRAHLPFGVVTRKQIGELTRYPAVVLPNVLRMSEAEVAAFRDYVRSGGRLYASRWTSLVSTSGVRHEDFALADVFGCSSAGEEEGQHVFFKPEPGWLSAQDYLSVTTGVDKPLCGTPRMRVGAGRALATLTLPYGYPARGTVLDHRWASIHSSPPWDDTALPAIVDHAAGEGRCVYSAASIEEADAEANEELFIGIVRTLLDGRERFGADAHRSVWMQVTDQTHERRLLVTLLHYPADLPPQGTEAHIWLRPPAGRRFSGLVEVPGERLVAHTLSPDGTLRATVEVGRLAALLASYA